MTPPASRRPLRLDGIVRQSQAKRDNARSPQQQRESHRSVGRRPTGQEIVRWHEGIGRSGKTMARDDVNAALARIKQGRHTEGVAVAWLDRFSRAPVGEALAVYDDFKGGWRSGRGGGHGGAEPRSTPPAKER